MPPIENEETTETPSETTTTPESSSPQPDADGRKLEFEEPDFSALTDFVENDGEATVAAAETEQTTESEQEEPAPSQESAAPAEERESESQEEVEETPAEVEGAESEEAPKKEAAKEETPAPAEPEVKVPTEEELTGMYKEHREKTLPTLENIYALSEEDAAALDENPSKVLPKLAARLHYDVMLSTYNAVLAAMPSVTNRLLHVSRQANTAETQFFEAWPDLKKPELGNVVRTAIHAYRAANPRAPLDDVIKKAGVMAMINAGLDPTKVKGKANGQTTPAAPRAAPARPAGARQTPQTTPPKPSGNEEANIFATMAEAFRSEYE